ncbi:hypothetical protein KSP40_PGU011682 [Platanthera guangdongensis]|uniref:Trichome birefringence-like C-terminal domain-containing protein n=1 Tax=Platanthera guangdongensis TaxID=2320717 RepID=A0ABR2N597_9ASPA
MCWPAVAVYPEFPGLLGAASCVKNTVGVLDSGLQQVGEGGLRGQTAEYNATVEFYWAPLIVESNSDDPVNHRLDDRIIRPNSLFKHASLWKNADILVFNSYLWWRSGPMIKLLWNADDEMCEEADGLDAMTLAMETWADWVASSVDRMRQRVFFVTMSPTHLWLLPGLEPVTLKPLAKMQGKVYLTFHLCGRTLALWGCLVHQASLYMSLKSIFSRCFRSREWNPGSEGNCFEEKTSINIEGYWGSGSDPNTMQMVRSILDRLDSKVTVINITQLSEYRKDGHPSIYRKFWETFSPQQLANPSTYSDCIHWCLPGVPDVWNELLFNLL